MKQQRWRWCVQKGQMRKWRVHQRIGELELSILPSQALWFQFWILRLNGPRFSQIVGSVGSVHLVFSCEELWLTWKTTLEREEVDRTGSKMGTLHSPIGGLEHEFYIFPSYWECHNPNWPNHLSIIISTIIIIIPTGVGQPPSSETDPLCALQVAKTSEATLCNSPFSIAGGEFNKLPPRSGRFRHQYGWHGWHHLSSRMFQ